MRAINEYWTLQMLFTVVMHLAQWSRAYPHFPMASKHLEFCVLVYKINPFIGFAVMKVFQVDGIAHLTITFGGSVLSFLSLSPSLSNRLPCFKVGGLGGFCQVKIRDGKCKGRERNKISLTIMKRSAFPRVYCHGPR